MLQHFADRMKSVNIGVINQRLPGIILLVEFYLFWLAIWFWPV
jgi:hypothetical protein